MLPRLFTFIGNNKADIANDENLQQENVEDKEIKVENDQTWNINYEAEKSQWSQILIKAYCYTPYLCPNCNL